jgi:hypothetical protein
MASMVVYMMSNKLPFSMILDGTKDITGNHVVLIYFQFMEGTRTVTVLLRLVALGVFNSCQLSNCNKAGC